MYLLQMSYSVGFVYGASILESCGRSQTGRYFVTSNASEYFRPGLPPNRDETCER